MSTTTAHRNTELRLGLLSVGITAFGYVLVQLPDKSDIPADLWFFVRSEERRVGKECRL